MKLCVVESPYQATEHRSLAQHKAYLNAALADCVRRGESPMASHHLLPDVLDDSNQLQRAIGIECGLVWGEHADVVAIYCDLGVSPGMTAAITHYKKRGKILEWRSIDHKTFDAILAMEG